MENMIVNSGKKLKDSPKNWEDAKKWTTVANSHKDEENEPIWSFDCGIKLDFDGSLITVNSRFYPPTEHYGNSWDGTVSMYLMGKKVKEKKFDCNSLDELKMEVEKYLEQIKIKLKDFCKELNIS